MTFNNLSEVWSYYDVKDRKHFDNHDLCAAIAPLKEGPEQISANHELLAFNFVASTRHQPNEWGTFYTYQFAGKNKNNEDVFIPDIKDITPEIIAYWEQRAATVINPLLKTRYTGLVLDFKKRITGNNPDYKTIKLAHIEALIEVVAGDYCKHSLITLDYAQHALKLANGFRKEDLKQRVVKAFYETHKQIDAKDSSAGLWGRIVKALIKYRKAFTAYEEDIIQENIDRLNRVEALALAEGNQTDSHAHNMEQEVDLLCEYYHSIGEDEKIEGLLDRLLAAMKLPIPVRGGMWGQIMLEGIQHKYRKYGLDRKANRLYVDITNLGSATIQEMQPTEVSFPVKLKMIEKFLAESLKGSKEEVLLRYIIHYIPIKEQEIQRHQERVKEDPFLDMVSTVNIDASGNVLNKIGAGKNAQEQKLHHSIYESISVSGFLMRILMEEIIDKKQLKVEDLMSLFEGCPLVNDNTRALLRRGMEAYLAGDDIACCHILVPQFEAMMRFLVAINGGEVLRQAKDPAEGNEYYSLESLLDSPTAKAVLPEDVLLYFKVLFVSQAGWNVRNSISHGLMLARSFNHALSDRVVHAILVLSQIRVREE